MVLNTLTVGAAVTPTVIETWFSHYLRRRALHGKPTRDLTYHEGLCLIRQFLVYASHHTVEEIQAFTSQWVPSPHWVKVDEVTIPAVQVKEAGQAIIRELGLHGVQKVGGETWWQWRRGNKDLKAEWIEMKADYHERKRLGEPCNRVMLYVHGGAYFFGSVDEHRYQMQRHARKLKARVLAPRYRLAPQYPFPCGLQDCIAAYLFLLTVQHPSTIILAGDSAGGGMVVSMLVTLRDQGIPLPAGAILISPWVDLTHSFPSVAGDGSDDYIPAYGFHQRPSPSWPPPNEDEMENIMQQVIIKDVDKEVDKKHRAEAEQAAVQGFSEHPEPETNGHAPGGPSGKTGRRRGNTIPGTGRQISIQLDGKMVGIKDQIQMYTTNQLISHPLVSPVLQPSLGGLPPLLILTGGGEMLRDEQIYLAHKAANPTAYPPGDAFLDQNPGSREIIDKYKPTDVQLQVWEDLCHVAPTLSFTRPAKYMYRSVAQFGAWVLARAQKVEIEILDDDDVSVISDTSTSDSGEETATENGNVPKPTADDKGRRNSKYEVGRAGDPIPPFRNHMIRQRVDRNGNIYPLTPISGLEALKMPAGDVGQIKPGPVRKWMAAKRQWDGKYARQKRAVQKQRIKEILKGYESFGNDEVPPPSALAGRRLKDLPEEKKKSKSLGLMLWSLWGSKHDEDTIQREKQADGSATVASTAGTTGGTTRERAKSTKESRSRSRRRRVTDAGQAPVDENTPAAAILERKQAVGGEPPNTEHLNPSWIPSSAASAQTVPSAENGQPASPVRPTKGPLAFPFKLTGTDMDAAHASTLTLTSAEGVVTPLVDEKGAVKGDDSGVAVQEGKLVEAGRPEPERFVTAMSGSELK